MVMDIKVIRDEGEYEMALKHLSKLMDNNPAPGSKEENALELLILVINDYEQRYMSSVILDPIEAIKFRMDQMEYTRKDLIPFFGSISRVSEVLSGKRSLSLSMIRKLNDGLGIPLESLVGFRPVHRKLTRKRKTVHHRISRSKRRKRGLVR
jgi:HTH-type transcriptional regulator/antitoxin HigA